MYNIDEYGRIIYPAQNPAGYGAPPAPTQEPQRQAVVATPTAAQMGGPGPMPFMRFPIYPTSPWLSTNPSVGYELRDYSVELRSNEADFTVGTETIRTVQFDIPCRIFAINGASVDLAAPRDGLITENNMNLMYLFRMEYTNGDRFHTAARLAATVVGTAKQPGELGGHGFNVDSGATVVCGITPLANDIRINITFCCLMMRPPANFSMR